MFDVAGPVGSEIRLDVYAECFCESFVDIDEILSAAVGNVVSFAGGLVSGQTGFQIRLDDVFDVGEVPALLPVAVDHRHLTMQELPDEFRDDGCVSSVRILTASEYVEIAKAIGVKAIVPGVLLRPLLIRALGDSVR